MSDEKTKFQVFRAKDAPTLEQSHVLRFEGITPGISQGLKEFVKAGGAEGSYAKILFNVPGFSLAHVWFKKDFPLPRHSHNCDCMYYIIAGSLQLGTEELGPRDGFFIPADVPYTYRPGPEGVELLEFRHATRFDIKLLADGEAFWQRAVKTAQERSEEWRTAKMPALNA